MSDDADLPSLDMLLIGARIIDVTEYEENGAEWTAFTLDNGFTFQVLGAVVVSHPHPN